VQKFGKVLQDRRQLVGPPYESGSIDVTYFDSEGNDKKDTQMGTQAKYIVVDASLVQGDMKAYHQLHERDMQGRVAVTEFEVDKVLWEMKKMGTLPKKIYPNQNLVYPPLISLELAQWMLDLTCQIENDAGAWYFASALSMMEDVARREHTPKVPPPLPKKTIQTKGNHVEAMQRHWTEKYEANEIDKSEYEEKMSEYQNQMAALGEPSSGGGVDASDAGTNDLHMAANDNDMHEVETLKPDAPTEIVEPTMNDKNNLESVPALKVEVMDAKPDPLTPMKPKFVPMPSANKKSHLYLMQLEARQKYETQLAEYNEFLAARSNPSSVESGDIDDDADDDDADDDDDSSSSNSGNIALPKKPKKPGIFGNKKKYEKELAEYNEQMAVLGLPTSDEDIVLPKKPKKPTFYLFGKYPEKKYQRELAEWRKQMAALGVPTTDGDDDIDVDDEDLDDDDDLDDDIDADLGDDIDVDEPLEPGAPTDELPTTNEKNNLQPLTATSTNANDDDDSSSSSSNSGNKDLPKKPKFVPKPVRGMGGIGAIVTLVQSANRKTYEKKMAEYNKQMEALGLPTSDLEDQSPDTTTTDAQKTQNNPDTNEVQSPQPTTHTEAADPTMSQKHDIEPKDPSKNSGSTVFAIVPEGVKPGGKMAVDYAGQRFELVVPPGSLPGSQIQVEIPSLAKPTSDGDVDAPDTTTTDPANKPATTESQSPVTSTAQLDQSSSVLETSRGKTKPVGIETRRSSGVPRKLPNRAAKNNQILTEKNVYQLEPLAKPGIAHNEDITPRNLPPRHFSQFDTNYGLDNGSFVRDFRSVDTLLGKAYGKFAAWFTTEPEPWHPDKSYQICASFPGLNNQLTTFNSFVDQNLAPHGQKWPMEKFLVYLDHEKEEFSQWIMNYEFIEKLVKPPTGAYSQDCIAGLVKGFYLILDRVNELKVPPPSSSTLERGVLAHFIKTLRTCYIFNFARFSLPVFRSSF